MTNIEKYNDAFVEVFGVDSSVLIFERKRRIMGLCSPVEYHCFVGRVF